MADGTHALVKMIEEFGSVTNRSTGRTITKVRQGKLLPVVVVRLMVCDDRMGSRSSRGWQLD